MSDVPMHAPGFKDHFSGHADDYARYRPGYPAELFDWLAGRAPALDFAWDAACGSGQAAAPLAERFGRVVASDASIQQLASVEAHPGVSYFAARAEASGLATGIADLITVAQAAHWFDMRAFAAEAARVLRPGGLVAVWCYGLARITPGIDDRILHLYDSVLGDYWAPERRLIDNRYRDLYFPFREIDAPAFDMTARWTLDRFLGYLGTWSAYRRYIEGKRDPLPALRAELGPTWGPEVREVSWPLHLRVGVV